MLRKTILTMLLAVTTMIVFAEFAASENSQGMAPSTQTHTSTIEQFKMQRLWGDQQSLSNEWSQILAHYNSMMQINDPTQLKTEMARHQEMMNTYNDKLNAFQEAWSKEMPVSQPRSTIVVHTKTVSTPQKMNMKTGN